MIDLHTHTTCSDGDYSPRDLIKMAARKGVRVLAITDHDNVQAYNSDLFAFADRHGVKLIPAVEFSTVDEVSGQRIHVVGLNIDVNHRIITQTCRLATEFRINKLMSAKAKLESAGFKVRDDKLIRENLIITTSLISQDVISNPENSPILKKTYSQIPLRGRFIDDFLSKGKLAHVSYKAKFTTSKAVDIIRKAGGKAICAHPSFNVMCGFDEASMHQLILRNDFDGIETINVQYNKKASDTRFDMTSQFTEFAMQYNLLTSGGSDFHGDNKVVHGEHSALGLSNEPYKVSSEQLALILNR